MALLLTLSYTIQYFDCNLVKLKPFVNVIFSVAVICWNSDWVALAEFLQKNLSAFSELEAEDTDLYKPQPAWAALSWLGEAKAFSRHVIDSRANRRNSARPCHRKKRSCRNCDIFKYWRSQLKEEILFSAPAAHRWESGTED